MSSDTEKRGDSSGSGTCKGHRQETGSRSEVGGRNGQYIRSPGGTIGALVVSGEIFSATMELSGSARPGILINPEDKNLLVTLSAAAVLVGSERKAERGEQKTYRRLIFDAVSSKFHLILHHGPADAALKAVN